MQKKFDETSDFVLNGFVGLVWSPKSTPKLIN